MSNQVTVLFKTPHEEQFKLTFNKSMLCQTLKKMVNNKLNNKIENIRLFYNNKLMEDTRNLCSYNIENGSIISIVFKKR